MLESINSFGFVLSILLIVCLSVMLTLYNRSKNKSKYLSVGCQFQEELEKAARKIANKRNLHINVVRNGLEGVEGSSFWINLKIGIVEKEL